MKLVCPTCKDDRYAEIYPTKDNGVAGYTLYCRRCEEGCVKPLVMEDKPVLVAPPPPPPVPKGVMPHDELIRSIRKIGARIPCQRPQGELTFTHEQKERRNEHTKMDLLAIPCATA